MGAEDFAYMLEARPGAYLFWGRVPARRLHHPKYNFNDESRSGWRVLFCASCRDDATCSRVGNMALEDAKNQVDHGFTREDLRGLSNENTFGGATSFLRRRYTKDLTGVDIAVTGVPFDQAVTNRPGTRLGPRAIREASSLQSPDAPYGWPFDVLSECAIVDYGDLAFDYADIPAISCGTDPAHSRYSGRRGGICHAWGGSLHQFPDPQSLRRKIRAYVPDPSGRAYGHVGG